jgi:2-oxoglutarate ferredoxin oxidoreductase subunit alpha
MPENENEDKSMLVGEHFINGDTACAEGALVAGCRFFAGYPITPATEIAERMSRRLPELGGVYIQMEDEIASVGAILGASNAGVKSMTATSGPGFSLMQENIGLAVMTETPCVIVDVMRGGPSTGLPTLVGQADIMQARWGSHGDYGIIALTPQSPQEMLDFTMKAFSLSEMYRLPVLVMGDEVVGHMTEKVIIPATDKIKIYQRQKPIDPPGEYMPYKPSDNLVPPMANAGEGYHVHVTGLTHDERGYPVITAEAQETLVTRLVDKIRKNADKIIDWEERNIANADVVIVAYGITARVSLKALSMARDEGIKVGMIRPKVIWPFPEKRICEISESTKSFVVPEINYGQISLEVERCAAGRAKTFKIPLMGGRIHTPDEILSVIKKAVKA